MAQYLEIKATALRFTDVVVKPDADGYNRRYNVAATEISKHGYMMTIHLWRQVAGRIVTAKLVVPFFTGKVRIVAPETTVNVKLTLVRPTIQKLPALRLVPAYGMAA